MRFAQPLWLLGLVLAFAPWLAMRRRPRLVWSSLRLFPQADSRRAASLGRWLVRFAPIARTIAIAAIVSALARPQVAGGTIRTAAQGTVIVAAIDRSSSMTRRDSASRSSRLEAARQALLSFAEARPNDLLGLVVFANYPDLICPPTLNRPFFQDAIESVKPASPLEDGTNLGDAIAWALDAARQASPKHKVIVLITDGVNSPAVPNPLDPLEAAGLAREIGATVHAIAIGGSDQPGEPGADLGALKAIAARGGGQAFAATDVAALNQVFQEIDRLEKSPIQGEIRVLWRDRHGILLGIAVLALALDRLSALTIAGRRLP